MRDLGLRHEADVVQRRRAVWMTRELPLHEYRGSKKGDAHRDLSFHDVLLSTAAKAIAGPPRARTYSARGTNGAATDEHDVQKARSRVSSAPDRRRRACEPARGGARRYVREGDQALRVAVGPACRESVGGHPQRPGGQAREIGSREELRA